MSLLWFKFLLWFSMNTNSFFYHTKRINSEALWNGIFTGSSIFLSFKLFLVESKNDFIHKITQCALNFYQYTSLGSIANTYLVCLYESLNWIPPLKKGFLHLSSARIQGFELVNTAIYILSFKTPTIKIRFILFDRLIIRE